MMRIAAVLLLVAPAVWAQSNTLQLPAQCCSDLMPYYGTPSVSPRYRLSVDPPPTPPIWTGSIDWTRTDQPLEMESYDERKPLINLVTKDGRKWRAKWEEVR